MAKTKKQVEEKVQTTNAAQNAARRTVTSNYDEQYMLFKYLREILKYKKTAEENVPDTANVNPMRHQKIIELDARPRECANLFFLQKADEVKGFLEGLPADFGYLVPEIKLYKPSIGADGTPFDRLVYMPDFALPGADGDFVRDIARDFGATDPDDPVIYRSAVGTNCGITSFTFDETQANFGFKAFRGNLVMNFASLKDFRDSDYIDLIDPRPDGEPQISPTAAPLPEKPSKADILRQQLETIDIESTSKKVNIRRKKEPSVKVVCGWATPNLDSPSAPKNKALYDFIRTSKRTLILHLSTYRTNFQENGQVSLDFEFMASVENSLKRTDSDIFQVNKSDGQPTVEVPTSQIPPAQLALLESKESFMDRLEIKGLLSDAKKVAGDDKEAIVVVQVTNEQLDRDVRRLKFYEASSDTAQKKELFVKTRAALKTLQVIEKNESITRTRRRFMDKIVGRASRQSGARINKLFEFAVPGHEVGFGYDRPFAVRPYDFKRTKTSEDSRKYTVPFIFLGDILDVAAEVGFDEKGNIVLGTIPAPGFPKNRISIGDMPIALETFTTWFNEVIGDPDRRQIPFHLFLTNLLKKIVAKNTFNLKGLDQLGGKIPDLEMNVVSVSGNRFGRDLVPGGRVRRSDFLTQRRDGVKTESNQVFESSDRLDLIFITTSTSRNVRGLRGSFEQDVKRGIYHFTVGADRGPLQTISFTEMENEHHKTHLMMSSLDKGGDLVSGLALPQNVTMSLKGSNLLTTGAYIYVDATFGLGRAVAERLRLGGYYRVITVNQSFTPQGWTTEVAAICELDSGNIRKNINRRNRNVRDFGEGGV